MEMVLKASHEAASMARNAPADENEARLLKKVHHAYSAPTWWYDFRGFFILLFAHRTSLWSLIRFFARNISDHHLEVPVGSGTLFYLTLLLHRRRTKTSAALEPHLTAVDYSETMVAGCRRWLRKFPRARCLVADVSQLDFPDNHFKSINVPNGIHCFPSEKKALAELHRVLQHGCKLAANVVLHPRGNRWMNAITQRIYRSAIGSGLLVKAYHVDEIRALVRDAGFEIEEEFTNGNTYHFVATKPAPVKC
jgi:ubiquinone/menaquinone biosynthesis C-methylase UbiE